MGTGSAPVVETDVNGNWTAEYIFFGGKRVAMRKSDGTVHYYFADQIGSANVVTNADGSLTEQDIEYHPYGEQQVYTDTLGQQYRFTGKERDPETGNDYFGARYYSSALGRFMTPDWAATPVPIPYAVMGNPQTLNLYSYVQNNPITGTDPDGHCCWDEVKGAATGTWNFAKNTVVSAVQLGAAIGQDFTSPVPINTSKLLLTPVINAAGDYRDKGVSGVGNDLLAQGEQGAMEIVTEAVLSGGLGAYSLKAPIESATIGLKGIGTGVPGRNVVVRGGTKPPPSGDQVYSGAQGATLKEAGKGVPNGQVQATTAANIRKAGGQVKSAPEAAYDGGPINPQHVNIRGGQSTFGPPQTNPAPKGERVPGRSPS